MPTPGARAGFHPLQRLRHLGRNQERTHPLLEPRAPEATPTSRPRRGHRVPVAIALALGGALVGFTAFWRARHREPGRLGSLAGRWS